MHIHYPSLVLVPDTFISPHSSSDAKASLLIDCIEGEFEDVPIEPVKRKYWNETVGGLLTRAGTGIHRLRVHPGLQFITQLAWTTKKEPPPFFRLPPSLVVRDLRICAWTQNKNRRYYALSALCALFKYSEMKLNVRYSAGSLSIRYTPVEGTMMIDPETIRNLELVGNMGNRKSNHSLFGCVIP
jgi:DNA mismatch repair protein MSH4